MVQLRLFKQPIHPLIVIVLVGAFLRLICLGHIPNGLQQDEAAAGYDAYSMLKTLHTQYDQFLPLFSKTYEGALNDYDETNYRFLIIPFISLFGLTEFTTRLPAALAGTLNIITFYLLVKVLFDRKTAVIAACLLAICPWHILISRIAFRTIIFNCLFCLALFLFLKGLKQRQFLPISGIAFGLTLYTYSSARVFVPLFLLGLVWIYRKELWRIRGYTLVASAGFLLILIGLMSYWISPELMERTNASVNLHYISKHPFLYFLYYISYFYPGFLFLGDPSVRTTAQHVGFLLLLDAVTIPAGLYFLLRETSPRKQVFILWLLLYPIPAALTAGAYDLRATIGIPLFVMLSADGLVQLDQRLRPRIPYFRLGVACLLTISLIGFTNAYYVSYYLQPPASFKHGLREAITEADKSSYDCIVVSDRFKRAHTMILFYTLYPPELYKTSPIEPYVHSDYTVGKFHIIKIARAEIYNTQCLYMIRPGEAKLIQQKGYQVQDVHTVKSPVGKQEIKLVSVAALSAKRYSD